MKQIATTVAAALIILLAASSMVQAQVNYSFNATSGVTFTPISGSAFTWSGGSADDDYSAATNIFDGTETFTYAGTAFTQFQVSTNGFIRLGTGLASSTPVDALPGTLRSIIAPLWDDLAVTAQATDVTYEVTGSSGNYVLTVEWRNVKWNKTAAANAEFQVKLYEATGNIEFVYGNMAAPTAGAASIGLADNSTITVTTNPATGKFLSINVGGSSGARVYHQSRGYAFNAINNAPDAGTMFTFTAVTPNPIAGGTYTIGGSSPTYATLSEAAQALNINGIAGAVVLNVRPGTYDDIFHLINVAGTSATSTITLKNESGAVILMPKNGSGTSTSGSVSSSDAIIRMDGTQYTTIQGLTLNDNGLATVMLKFEIGILMGNSVNADLTGTMGSGGRYNTFKNLTIDMKSTTGIAHAGAIGIRYFTTGSSETDAAKSTSYNTIDNCTITGFWRAAWKNFGISATNPDVNNSMKNCTIGNFTVSTGTGSDIRALEMDVQTGLIIENNVITSIENTINTSNNIYGVWLNPSSSTTNMNNGTLIIRNNRFNKLYNSGAGTTSGYAVAIASNNVSNNTDIQIYGNKIYDIYSNGSTTSRAIGIGVYASTGTGVTAKIYNNMISDLRAPRSTSAPSVRALDIQNGGGTGVFSVYNNSVDIDNAVPPTLAAHYSTCLYFASMSTGTIDLRNNIFINTMSSTSGKAACIMPSAAVNYARFAAATDYNLYYWGTTGATNGLSWDFTTLRQTIAAHQSAAGGARDANAKSEAVTFTSSSDLHLAAPSNGNHHLIGMPLTLFSNDIDGDTRSENYPYIGADEASVALPVELSGFTAATHGTSIILSWKTATETNNHGFDVEKLIAGAWTKIGFVEGAGSSNSPKSYQFVDAQAQGRVSYRLKQVDRDGGFTYSSVVEAAASMTAPEGYELAQNYPNPFNPSTAIRFAVKQSEHASLKVYDVTGREVAELFNDQAEAGKYYQVTFNAGSFASGMYIYVLQTPSHREVKKMQLLK